MKEDLMVVRSMFALVVALGGGCVERNAASCVDDGKCSDPLRPFCDKLGVFGEPNMCIAVSCTPEELVACNGDEALVCDSSGADYVVESCPYGCGESGCNPYLEPRYLPDVCDTPASEEEFSITRDTLLDTDLDTNCNGGILPQSGGPSVCVVRYRSIVITTSGTLSVSGSRALALVADDDVTIEGVLDVSANGATDGPGGGFAKSGGEATLAGGGGGAGFQTPGAHGGDFTTPGGALNGGAPTLDVALLSALVGGTRGAIDMSYPVESGGGGGAATLIACRGAAGVSGILDAGGGGGRPGGNVQFACLGGGGGGSGGHIAVQGMSLSLTGQAFANGGGGGAGKPNNQTPNEPGEDGRRDQSQAFGGHCAAGGTGGGGGAFDELPTVGYPGQSPGCGGGGGGSVGYMQTFTPEGVTPTLNPSLVSPSLEEHKSIAIRTRVAR
jgi:hypothetical protein